MTPDGTIEEIITRPEGDNVRIFIRLDTGVDLDLTLTEAGFERAQEHLLIGATLTVTDLTGL